MQLAPPAPGAMHRPPATDQRELVVRSSSDVPFQPPVGEVTYTGADGRTSRFRVMPFLRDAEYWSRPYAGLSDAVAAANRRALRWDGLVTFGVVQAAEGHFQIRPMESERGRPFVIDPDLLYRVGAAKVTATATAPELQAIVGRGYQLDFSDPTHRADVAPTKLP
jgi:hypothetical protein